MMYLLVSLSTKEGIILSEHPTYQDCEKRRKKTKNAICMMRDYN